MKIFTPFFQLKGELSKNLTLCLGYNWMKLKFIGFQLILSYGIN